MALYSNIDGITAQLPTLVKRSKEWLSIATLMVLLHSYLP